VLLCNADICEGRGAHRLSWHMGGGSGGWRCGETQDLMDSHLYRKSVYLFTPQVRHFSKP
jgi:hypothetical protein